MEFVLLVAATVLILPIGLLVAVVQLYSRLSELEKRVQATFTVIEQRLSAQTVQTAPVLAPSATADHLPQTAVSARPTVTLATPAPNDDPFTAWLKENWLLKLGAFLILLAFGWFVTYAFLNNWIGPAGRIALGLAGGAAILALGFWRMRTFPTQGAVFTVLGATGILLTTYAARSLYDFFTPTSSLILMFATSALVAFISGTYNRKQLAVASVALAGFAPLLTSSPSPDYIGLFWYLLIVVAGAIWIVFWKDFREVVLTALVVVALYSMPALSRLQTADVSILLLFGYAFATLFYLTNTIGLRRLKGADAQSDLITAVGNALLLLGWIVTGATKEWQSLIIDAWAVAFVFGAFVLHRTNGRKEPLFLYAAIGVGYIATSTALVLHGPALIIAFTLESAVVAVVLYAVSRDVLASLRSSLLILVPTVLALPSIAAPEWRVSMYNEHFFVLTILSATYFALSILFWRDARTHSDDARTLNAALIVGGSFFAYVTLWLMLHAALPLAPDTAVMISLLVYAAIGVGAYVYGLADDGKGFRLYGGILLGFVVGRLLLVDVWQMALTGRIITFFLIGALLMSTAFFGQKKRVAQPTVPQATPPQPNL